MISKTVRKIPMFALVFIGFSVDAGSLNSEGKKMPSSQIEANAKADFDAVVAGKKPVYATQDDSLPDMADGGSTFYKGDGYSLKVKQTISKKNGIQGYLYGPVITFEGLKKNGKAKELSDVRFYSTEDLKKLKGK